MTVVWIVLGIIAGLVLGACGMLLYIGNKMWNF
jgi:hypothetical protein